ncbi:hypothetical protein KFK09_014718 [Dendrobium nobile]|uniref:Tf2-1-like SH3-like domain-containing protein n=1 Tax=Dendrobium nobile TaxID=94219 RepID=A0A8T3B467_DENNO|nr:hypothetical protein KFK09_014718 [Dendrobium nobile]
MLCCLVQDNPKKWDEILSQAKFAYNSMPNRSTVTNMAGDFKSMLENVRRSLQTANESYKQAADVHRRFQTFQPGGLVMVRMRKERHPTGTYSKLAPKKLGPVAIKHKISDNAYVLELPSDVLMSSTFNVAEISPYYPPDSANTEIDSSDMNIPVAGVN